MPNLDASTARVVVRMPLSTTPVTDSGEITLTLPTGVYDLNGVSAWLNEAVNEWLHTNGYPVLVGDWRSYYNHVHHASEATSMRPPPPPPPPHAARIGPDQEEEKKAEVWALQAGTMPT